MGSLNGLILSIQVLGNLSPRRRPFDACAAELVQA